MTNNQQHLSFVADKSLITFEQIAEIATQQLADSNITNHVALIPQNTFTPGAATNEMRRIQQKNKKRHY